MTTEVVGAVPAMAERWRTGLRALQESHPRWLVEVRQTGLIIGLKFAHEAGGMLMTRLLYDEGVWAMFAGFDRSVLHFKPSCCWPTTMSTGAGGAGPRLRRTGRPDS
jgi:acetylornithine/succinyldiaminopimelate/putrescine aminotransferase